MCAEELKSQERLSPDSAIFIGAEELIYLSRATELSTGLLHRSVKWRNQNLKSEADKLLGGKKSYTGAQTPLWSQDSLVRAVAGTELLLSLLLAISNILLTARLKGIVN